VLFYWLFAGYDDRIHKKCYLNSNGNSGERIESVYGFQVFSNISHITDWDRNGADWNDGNSGVFAGDGGTAAARDNR
jgi:hypothetical protein